MRTSLHLMALLYSKDDGPIFRRWKHNRIYFNFFIHGEVLLPHTDHSRPALTSGLLVVPQNCHGIISNTTCECLKTTDFIFLSIQATYKHKIFPYSLSYNARFNFDSNTVYVWDVLKEWLNQYRLVSWNCENQLPESDSRPINRVWINKSLYLFKVSVLYTSNLREFNVCALILIPSINCFVKPHKWHVYYSLMVLSSGGLRPSDGSTF